MYRYVRCSFNFDICRNKDKEKAMWYVMQVRTGSEENIQLQCQKDISSEVLEDCFIPYYEEKRNIKGEWTTQRKRFFLYFGYSRIF